VTTAILRLNQRTFASLRHRNYRLFFFGQVVSVTGTWMQNIAMAWLVLELTGSPVAVGILALCQFLPFTTLGWFSGVLTDRFDARRLVLATQWALMAQASLLAALTLLGQIEPWQIYVLAVLRGCVMVFDAPARQALTYQMVGPAELPNAVALNSSLFNAARVIGPAIGGVVVAAFDPGVCFGVNAVSFVAVLGCLTAMRVRDFVPVKRQEEAPTVFRGTWEAVTYARSDKRVGVLLVLVCLVSTFAFNFNVLLPVLAKNTLHSGAEVFGILSASFGAGALAGALLSAARGRASVRAVFVGTAGFGAAELLLALSGSLVPAVLLLFVTGATFTIWTSNSNATLQLGAPDHIRGRVLGLYFYAFLGAQPIGGLVSGWLADVGGTGLAFAVGGTITLTATAYALTRLVEHPTLRVAQALGLRS
jgi:MFS family permease